MIRPPRLLFRQAIARLGAIAFVLLSMEFVLRLWIATPATTEPDPQFEYFQRPYSRQVHSSEGYSRTHMNEFGFNDEDPWQQEPRRRALLVGDSYTEAMQVYPGQNFGSVAESLVDGLEVCNAGRAGWGPPDLVAFAKIRGRQFSPDVVVIQLNDGDLREFFRPGSAHMIPDQDGWELVVPEIRADASWSHALLRSLMQSSSLITLLGWRSRTLLNLERGRLRERFVPRAVQAAGLTGKSRTATDSQGVPFEATDMLCALHWRLNESYPDPIYVCIPRISYLDDTVAYPRRRAIYHEFAARTGAVFIDPTDALLAEYHLHGQPCHGFQNSEMGKGHLNARGHRVVGELLAAELRKRLPKSR